MFLDKDDTISEAEETGSITIAFRSGRIADSTFRFSDNNGIGVSTNIVGKRSDGEEPNKMSLAPSHALGRHCKWG